MNIRKIVVLILAAAMMLVLFAACGSEEADISDLEVKTASAVPPIKSANGNDNAPAEASESAQAEAAPENEEKAAAEKCIGQDVEALYEAVGYPVSSEYASSCLGSGEDGELKYDGFTVYTYKEGDSETVQSVE